MEAAICSLAPLLRGEGWGEGLHPRVEYVDRAPHPDLLPVKNGEKEKKEKRRKQRVSFPP
jgi:hypothetical protein